MTRGAPDDRGKGEAGDIAIRDAILGDAEAFLPLYIGLKVAVSGSHGWRLRSTQNSLPSGSDITTQPVPSGRRWSATTVAPMRTR